MHPDGFHQEVFICATNFNNLSEDIPNLLCSVLEGVAADLIGALLDGLWVAVGAAQGEGGVGLCNIDD